MEIHVRFHLSQDKESQFFVVIVLEKQNQKKIDILDEVELQEEIKEKNLVTILLEKRMTVLKEVQKHFTQT